MREKERFDEDFVEDTVYHKRLRKAFYLYDSEVILVWLGCYYW